MRSRRSAILLVASLLATTCAPAAVAPSASPTAEEPVRGGRVIDSGFEDIKGLDPVLAQDAISARIISKIYDPLIAIDPRTGEPKPGLGSWTQSGDGRTYTWRIDAAAAWSDGRPITGRDLLARVKLQARSRTTPSRATFNEIEGYQEYASGKATDITGIRIDPGDPKSFSVKLTRSFCPALTSIFGTAPLPAHVFARYIVDDDPTKTVDQAPENDAPPVASGPFKLKEWRKGDQVTLTRNDSYWAGAPYLDEYVYKVVLDQAVQVAQLRTGELSLGVVRAADVAGLTKEKHLRIYRWIENAYTFVAWLPNDPKGAFLRDKRVRQALWYALDVDAVIRDALGGEGVRQLQHHAVGSWAAAPVDQLERYAYDPGRAAELLGQAGYAKGTDGVYAHDGSPLALTVATSYPNRERDTFLRIATEQYARLGIRIETKVEPYETLAPKLTSGSASVQAVIIGWQLPTETDPFTIWHSSSGASLAKPGNNIVGYTNSDVDRLIELARYGPDCSQAARQRAYQQMNRILNADAPYLFGMAAQRLLAADARIRGLTPGAFNASGDANSQLWWIKR